MTNLLSILSGLWLLSFLLMLGALARGYAASREKIGATVSSRKARHREPVPIELPVHESRAQVQLQDAA